MWPRSAQANTRVPDSPSTEAQLRMNTHQPKAITLQVLCPPKSIQGILSASIAPGNCHCQSQQSCSEESVCNIPCNLTMSNASVFDEGYSVSSCSSSTRSSSPPTKRLHQPYLPVKTRHDRHDPRPAHRYLTRVLQRFSLPLRWLIVLVCITLSVIIWNSPLSSIRNSKTISFVEEEVTGSTHKILRPAGLAEHGQPGDPEGWLRENSNNAFSLGRKRSWRGLGRLPRWTSKPKAAIISLVRNEELDGIMQSIRQLEFRWNHKYRYPWIFLNEKPFSDEFKVRAGLVGI